MSPTDDFEKFLVRPTVKMAVTAVLLVGSVSAGSAVAWWSLNDKVSDNAHNHQVHINQGTHDGAVSKGDLERMWSVAAQERRDLNKKIDINTKRLEQNIDSIKDTTTDLKIDTQVIKQSVSRIEKAIMP